jgi:hypothetical protein
MKNSIRILLLSFLFLVCFIDLFAANSNLQTVNPAHKLFDDVSLLLTHELRLKQAQESQDPTVHRSRLVQVNFHGLENAESVVLDLFDNVSKTALRERVERRSENRYSWFGRMDGMEHSTVVLVVEDGNMAGNITFDGKIYQVRSVIDGIHSIREFDQSALPSEAPPIPVEVPQQEDEDPLSLPQLDSGDTIDVMVVYTDDVALASFSIASEIQLAIDETNVSYQNSGINQRLRLVDTVEVNYAEAGNMNADLNCITSPSDGCLDSAHTWRDNAGADMVSFWVENGGPYCGIAWLMTTVSSSFESNAFSVVARQCATGNYTFGHELGHNMGAHHDRYVTSGQGAYPHSYGYVYTPDRWLTIMAYNRECTDLGFFCTRIQHWSNPDINYNGVPTGVAEGQPDAADNRKTLNKTALTVANFRQSQGELFVDVPPGSFAEEEIYKIFNAGITAGCSKSPLKYCPTSPVTRAQMAIFLLKSKLGSGYTPPPATGIFDDVPVGSFAEPWIEDLYNRGITAGCQKNPLRYCPTSPVTRWQMAIFLLKTKLGSGYTPPPATGIFDDVPVGSFAEPWIEDLYNRGITAGCRKNPLRYCPDSSATRAQMAIFLVRTFNL